MGREKMTSTATKSSPYKEARNILSNKINTLSKYGAWSVFLFVSLLNQMTPSSTILRPNSLFLSFGLIIIALIYTLRSLRKLSSFSESIILLIDILSCVFTVLGSFLVILSKSYPSLISTPEFGLGVAGLASSWLYLRWASCYADMQLHECIRCILLGTCIWLLLRMVQGLIEQSLPILLITLPPVSLYLLRRISHSPEIHHLFEIRFNAGDLGLMGKAWFTIFCVALSHSVSNMMLQKFGSPSLPIQIICSIVLICSTLVFLKFNKSFEFVSVWRFFIYVIALIVACIPLHSLRLFLSSFLMGVWYILLPTVWVTTTDIARHSKLHPLITLGFSLSLYTLPISISPCLQTIITTDGITSSVEYTTLLLLLLVTLGTCLNRRDPGTMRIFEDLRDDRPLISEHVSIIEHCRRIGETSGLTPRETEIFEMIAIGRSRAFIAESLLISENTVKTHVSRIYAKLGVHTKKDIDRLLGTVVTRYGITEET